LCPDFVVKGVPTLSVDDVPVEETWARLQSDKEAILIDVRTKAEWTFVGLPDLSGLGRQVVTLEWQSLDGRVDPAFADRLSGLLEQAGKGKGTELFFICRSGARSRAAAEAMTSAGFGRCHNVAEGFEGPPDANRHRGKVAGWKAAGLPWAQG
jgi:rhodanese-related sulfurtransferase